MHPDLENFLSRPSVKTSISAGKAPFTYDLPELRYTNGIHFVFFHELGVFKNIQSSLKTDGGKISLFNSSVYTSDLFTMLSGITKSEDIPFDLKYFLSIANSVPENVLNAGLGQIRGNVYKVNTEGLMSLDKKFENGYTFKRYPVKLVGAPGSSATLPALANQTVWMYEAVYDNYLGYNDEWEHDDVKVLSPYFPGENPRFI